MRAKTVGVARLPVPDWRRRAWLVGALLAPIALYTVLTKSGWLSTGASLRLADWLWLLFSMAAALRCGWTALRCPAASSHRVAWLLLASAAASWCSGMVYLMVRQAIDADFPSYPTLANWLFLGFAPLFAAGVYFLRLESPGQAMSLKRLADLGILLVSVLTISIIVLLEPLLVSGASRQMILFSVLDPVAFVVAAMFLVIVLWFRDLGANRFAGLLLFGAIFLHTGADLLYFRAWLLPLQSVDLEPVWMLAFALQIWAATEFDERRSQPARSQSRPQRAFGESVLPALLILVIVVVAAVFREQLTTRTMLVIAPPLAGLGICLGLREWLVDRAQHALVGKLRASTALAEHLQSASPAVVFVAPPQPPFTPNLITSNVSSEFGIAAHDPWNWAERVHPEDRRDVERVLEEVCRCGSGGAEYRLLDGSGAARWVYQQMVLVTPSRANAQSEIVGSIIDISRRKELEEEVMSSQRMEALGRLSGGIAHDFNNVLTTVLGYAELELARQPDEEGRESLEAIRSAGLKASGLTAQLLAFSRKQPLTMTSVDTVTTINGIVSMLSSVIGERVDLVVVPPPGPAVVQADPVQLEQVILNLVLNARDAMPQGGVVTIAVDHAELGEEQSKDADMAAGAYVAVSVSDTGTGMAPEVAARVFEPFFTTKAVGLGTGLGLAVIHGIVRQHRGSISLHTQEGVGTTFRVLLPASERPPSSPPRAAAPMVAVRQGTETVLVVDDEPSIPRLVHDVLVPAGYRVLMAHSSEQALEMCEDPSMHLDLVLTDVVLPELNGPDLARSLRRTRPGLKVVFMSGYVDDLNELEEARTDGSPLISKPLMLGHLARVLSAELGDASPSANA